MSFYLMKRTKDDEKDLSKQNELHIDSVLSEIKCTDHQKLPGEARQSRFPRVFGLIIVMVQVPFYSKELGGLQPPPPPCYTSRFSNYVERRLKNTKLPLAGKVKQPFWKDNTFLTRELPILHTCSTKSSIGPLLSFYDVKHERFAIPLTLKQGFAACGDFDPPDGC